MFAPETTNNRKKMMVNYTGEPVQPARLYYHITNKKTVLGVFKKLRCVSYIPWLEAWQWLYENEAKKIHFDRSYNKVPKDQRPIALGQFRIRGEDLMLDLRSFDRALAAIEFFDKRINRRAAQVYKLRVVNRLLDASQPEAREQAETPYDRFFDERDAEVSLSKADKIESDLDEIREQHADEVEREAAMSDYFEILEQKPTPELEEIPVHFYEEGLSGLSLALKTRTIEAQQHWQGNTRFSRFDFMREMVSRFIDDLDEDDDAPAEDVPMRDREVDPGAEPQLNVLDTATPDTISPETNRVSGSSQSADTDSEQV
ncbi:MAG: hypothetical protein AAGG51_02810 [Cyanobacteria bacterium P01_G01_bin.54]